MAHDVLSPAAPVETLVSQFEEQARRSPDAIALECAGVILTYAEFDSRVNALAHHLVGLGVGPDTLVGLAGRRSIDLVVGMYAILKAGGAYLPIDPDHPVDRIARVLSVAEPALVLTTAHDEPEFGGAVRTLRIDEFAGPPAPDAPTVVRSADAVAYVIFTSGPTGLPKGVAVTHRAIVANLRWRQRMFRLRADDVVLQKTPFTCDVSVWECFWPLQVGARLVVAAPDGHRDPAYLARVIRERGVTVTHFVPSVLAVFVAEPRAVAVDSLRLVFASGEALAAATAAAFRDICGATLHNLYGLAEAAVDVTAHEVTGADAARVPIGVAADDMELLVLDDSLRSVARGVVGELYLAGVQLARGYLARPGLTAERFVANPDGPAGERMYRTGDLVRWAPGADGGPDELEYLGRTDLRDSLRDRRTEVEAALLDALPLNAGGELDRRALPEPELGSAAAVYRAPGAAVAAPARPPLTAEPRPQRVPLSPAQRRVWFLNRFGADAERARDPGAAAVDNISVALRLRGPLEVSALSAALTDLVARHEVLRTVYPQTADGPVQSVRRVHAVFDLTPADVPEDRLVAAIRRAAGEGFDVAEEIPVRARLLRCGPRDHTLVLVVHHIAADEVSLGPLTRDLATAYAARHEGRAPQWAPLTVQYADYTLWLQRVLGAQTAADAVAARQLAFWRAELAGLPARLELPADRPRPATASYRGATHEFDIDAALRADVEAIAARVRATPFTVLHAALAALLARLSGTGDIAIGTPVPGRGAPALDDLVGMFVNTLVLRTEVDGEAGFAGLLARVADRDLRAFAHADIPFEHLVEALNPARSAARHPLFQVALRMPDLGPIAPAMPGLETERVDFDPGVAKFDLQLTVSGAAAGYRAAFTYATDLFDPATVREFAAKFVRLLRAAVRDPDAALGDIPLLDAGELDYVTASWNASGHKVPDRFLHEGFDAQARRTPDAVALIGDTERLSYAELSDRADRLARMLIGIGVGPEALVVLALPRSVELVVAMYAVARAGGAYVPVDPAHPAERIGRILDSARPQVVLTIEAAEFDAAAHASAPTYHLDDLDLSTYPSGKISDRERLGPLHPLHPAYVIFTAGSTGKPKGVTVSHQAIANQLAWMHAEYRPGTGDVYLQKTASTSDVSLWGYFLPLRAGATLLLALPERDRDPRYLAETVARERVTLTDFAPSMLAVFAAHARPGELGTLREVFVIGEALPPETVAALGRVCDARLHNLYGPTEAAVSITNRPVTETDTPLVPIGEPEWNSQVYVLDRRLRPAPIGVPGELYLAGAQLARGYHGRVDRTADRFVANPFGPPGARMYRTGDLARWSRDGELIYLGRNNCQAQRLPASMVPTALVEPAESASGELDRAALPVPALAAARFRPPVHAAQRLVAAVFAEVLGVERVGLDDDFFALGGSSLDATQVTARAGAAVGVRVPVRALFDAPTVEGFAAEVDRLGRAGATRLPLVRRDRPEPAPLTPAQQRLWFLNRIESQDGADSVYNLPIVLRLTGRLDVTALERAVLDVLARHETLRTTYPETDSGPCRSVLDAADIGLSLHPAPIDRRGLRDAVAGIVRAGFDVTTELPCRVALLAVDRVDESRGLAGDEFVLVFVVHHIAADALSTVPLVTDLFRAYRARLTGRPPDWDALPVRYADYIRWHGELLGAEDAPGDLAYQQLRFWRDVLAGAPAQMPLPADRPRPAVPSSEGAAVDFVIQPEVAAGLRALARRTGATLFMTLHAAFAATLARLSGSADIVIGTPVGGRGERALDDLVGMFANTLALRTRVPGDASFTALLADVREGDLAAFANADLPFERLVDAMAVDRTSGAHPLFQVMIGLEAATAEFGGKAVEAPWLSVRPVEIADDGAKFDLHLIVRERAGSAELSGTLRYATDLFDAATIESYVARLRRILVAVAVDPDARIGDIELLSDAERHQILREWNATEHPAPESDNLAALFAAQVASTPDAPAITFERTAPGHPSQGHTPASHATLTYAEFAGRVNRLARWLVEQGVGPESLVALGMRRSIDLVVGMYAVTVAGGGYLPLDPDHPAERIAHVLATAAPVRVLTAGVDLRCGAVETRIDRLDLSGYSERPLTDADRRAPLRRDNTAYVLFTSGSTGSPKGVVMSHRGIVNRLRWMQSAYVALGPGDVLLQKTPATFDVSVPEFFWPLLVGARLVLARADGHRDPAYLARLIRTEGVTAAHFVPSMLADFVAEALDLPSLREVFCSGEALPVGVAQRMRALTGARVHNGYGPTEAAVEVTFHQVSDTDFETVPMGKPIWNTRTYVLDARLRPVPAGVPGELYLAGVQLARGYLGRPEPTANRFVADPFGPPGERMYRTGDLVRWTAAGELEFLGRTDSQVEIRGSRIDFAEIEAALLATSGIAQAAALVRDDHGTGKRLVAYLVTDGPIDIPTVRDTVAARLPGYLVPQAFVVLERFPLSASGKLDRTALPAPAFAPAGFRAPVGAAETLVAETISTLLGVTEVSAEDDFFALGGDSLSAIQLAARLGEAIGAEVAVRTIFDAPTVRALARRIAVDGPIDDAPVALPPLTPQERGGPLPLSIGQQRMWLLNRFDAATGAYNIPFALRLTGALNVPALAAAIADVIDRHETLRTIYPEQDGGATQVILPAGTKLVELVARPVPAAQVPELIAAAARTGFDVTAEVPLRVRLLRVENDARSDGQQVHVLLFVVHHIAADSRSFAPLTRDLANAYVARCAGIAPAPGPPVQYADFAIWQRAALGCADDPASTLSRRLAYWTDRLAGLPEVVTLPSDRPRPAVATHRGGATTGRLDADLHARIQALATAHRATPFTVLHTALAVLLSRYGAGPDVVIGAPVAGRDAEALDELVGMFVNTLVLRTEVRPEATLAELLASVRAADLAAFDHAAVPFERVIEVVNPVRSRAHAPLYQVALSLQHEAAPRFRLHRLAIAALELGAAPIQLDLDWTLTDHYTADGAPDGIDVRLHYALDLFDEPTAAGFVAAFERVLRAMVRDPRTPVGTVELMSVAERGMLLSDRNATAHALPAETLDDLLTARVAATPDDIGVRYEDTAVTYAEFASRVNRLARGLIEAGVGPERIVGLAASRSIDMLVAMYAIVRAGGAYLPLDPAHSAERLTQLLASAAPRLVLTAGGATLPALDGVPVLDLADLDLGGVPDGPVADAERIAALRPANTAYVLFTSGSTGAPKGVAVAHRAIMNQLRWLEHRYGATASDRILQRAPLTSDLSVWECFLPIAVGAPLVIARPGERLDLGCLADLMRAHRITIAAYPPSVPVALIGAGMGDALRSLRHLHCGGEALTPGLLAALRGSFDGVVHNAYGPAEAAIAAIHHQFTDADAASGRDVAIGRPCWNTRAYVLDARLRPVPIGVTGELYLAGDQLARGYHARPGLTAERFVADPFGVPGRVMYRTGDLVRWNRDGDLVYLIRNDAPVELGGRRIRLGEVEAVLAAATGVRNAAVLVARDHAGQECLVGYVTGPGTTPEAVLDEARAQLPAHLVPAHVVVLDELPLTTVGKLDRSALPAVEFGGAAMLFRPPREGAEAVLATLVADVTGAARVGADDDFFALGGNSPLAMRLVARANAVLGCALTVREVFEAPTVAGLALRVARSERDAVRPVLAPVERPARIPLSPAQTRMWLLHRLDPDSALQHIPITIRLTGALDVAALRSALRDVIGRHESLRTVFPADAEGPAQVVLAECHVPELPLEPVEVTERDLPEAVLVSTVAGFDLSTAIPLRANLFRLAPQDHVLALVVHHIAADGASTAPLTRDLMTAYTARVMGKQPSWRPLPVQYPDFTLWQRAVLASADDPDSALSGRIAYWRAELAGLPPVLELPADRPRPPVASGRGATVEFAIPADLTGSIAALARRHGVSTFMVLHAACATLLARLTGVDDVAVGTPVTGRGERAQAQLVGLFADTLVLRTRVAADASFAELLARVRDIDVRAFAHADLPFERLVQELNPVRSRAHAPIVQTLLSVEHHDDTVLRLPGLTVSAYPLDDRVARVDLAVELAEHRTETGAALRGVLRYATDLFDRDTIATFGARFLRVLRTVLADPSTRVGDLELLDDAERALVLHRWNDTAAPVDPAATLISLFEAQVARTPDVPAVTVEGRTLTYAEFAGRARRLARWLAGQGVGPEAPVALGMRRSLDLLVGVYAVTLAGGAYVPLDPDHPAERLEYVLSTVRPVCVLTSGHDLDAGVARQVRIDRLHLTGYSGVPLTALDRLGTPEPGHTAYVIFTSGSTGRPKGVAVTHAAIVNRLTWTQSAYPLAADDVVLHKAPAAFDVSVWEIFWPLAFGARLVVARPDECRDPGLLARLIIEQRVTTVHFVPTMLGVFLADARSGKCITLRNVFASGEALPAVAAQRAREVIGARVHNLYGPTEAAGGITCHEVVDTDVVSVPIGRPVADTRLLVLDARMRPVPVGVPGELYLAGAQLARGYVACPELTANRFVADPFGPAGARMYRTGDLVAWRGDGELEYLGRTDVQVRLHGMRIEPGAIEAALLALNAVAQAVALVRADERSGDQLVAYLVASGRAELDIEEVRAALRAALPAYLVPAAFVVLERMPV
ncbi:amino acid adenylation domain-containing protein, partial [Nocardia asiatica]|uniref:amino acid adenylation domain-containing protein n=1 Tax=Nocardia asiatica TaxID=209252 RepID=UPI00402BC03C